MWDTYECMIRETIIGSTRRYKTNRFKVLILRVRSCTQSPHSLVHPTDYISDSHFRNPQLLSSGFVCIFVEPRIQSALINLTPETPLSSTFFFHLLQFLSVRFFISIIANNQITQQSITVHRHVWVRFYRCNNDWLTINKHLKKNINEYIWNGKLNKIRNLNINSVLVQHLHRLITNTPFPSGGDALLNR